MDPTFLLLDTTCTSFPSACPNKSFITPKWYHVNLSAVSVILITLTVSNKNSPTYRRPIVSKLIKWNFKLEWMHPRTILCDFFLWLKRIKNWMTSSPTRQTVGWLDDTVAVPDSNDESMMKIIIALRGTKKEEENGSKGSRPMMGNFIENQWRWLHSAFFHNFVFFALTEDSKPFPHRQQTFPKFFAINRKTFVPWNTFIHIEREGKMFFRDLWKTDNNGDKGLDMKGNGWDEQYFGYLLVIVVTSRQWNFEGRKQEWMAGTFSMAKRKSNIYRPDFKMICLRFWVKVPSIAQRGIS